MADRVLLGLSTIGLVLVPILSIYLGVAPGKPSEALALFGAAGTMGGFMVASLALVLASESSPRVKEIAKESVWRSLLLSLVISMWAWMLTALTAFVFWWTDWVMVWHLTFGFSLFAIASCVRALLFISALVGRFRPLT